MIKRIIDITNSSLKLRNSQEMKYFYNLAVQTLVKLHPMAG
jgi:hypothetical protein